MWRALSFLCVAAAAGASAMTSYAQTPATQPARSEVSPPRTSQSSQAALQQRLAEFRVEGIPFEEVISAIAQSSGANIYVKWKQLELAGVDRQTPVSVQLHNTTLSKTLDIVLDSVETGDVNLGYYVHENVITIGLSASRHTNLVTRAYDLTDLMFIIPDLDPADFSGNGAGSGRGQQGSSNGGRASQ